MKMRAGLVRFIAIIQAILFLAHFFLYETWSFSAARDGLTAPLWLKIALSILSVSFLVASLLAWRYTGATVRAIYKVAAVWLGLLSFLFIAAVFSWVSFAVV
jgi:hypothetical protein